MTQQIQQPIIIDSNAELQVKENLLDIIAELKDILQFSIKVLSPEANQSMTQKPKPEFRVNSIAGCCDQKDPFLPKRGNICETCHLYSDVTCKNFPKKNNCACQP
jgi:hypothetical protein